jgi:hypothetical protein
MSDPEIEAMSTIATALAELEQDARERVLRWAGARYDVTIVADERRSNAGSRGPGREEDPDGHGGISEQDVEGEAPAYEHFAELFAAASPKSNEDRALVAAYWVQIHGGQAQWQSRQLNKELKHLGHAIPNITDALTKSIRKKPQRVIQLKKSGGSRQSTKTYKVTNEGIVYVRGMLGSGSS